MQNDSHLMATADMVQQPDGEGAPLLPCKYNVSLATKNVHDVDANGVISPHSVSSPPFPESYNPWILGLVQVLVMLLRVILEEYEAGH
jgi:hypothetical protein